MKFIFLAAYAVALVRWGFGRRAGFCSWHMFAGASICHFDLTESTSDGRMARFNPWKYLPHTLLTMDREHMLFFISYLRAIRRLNLNGRVELRENGVVKSYRIRNSHVVA